MYQVQFISSGIVAFSSADRGLCQHFIDCNNYGEDKPIFGEDTSGSEGEVIGYERGDSLNLFCLKKVK